MPVLFGWPMDESKSHHITSDVNIPYVPKWFSPHLFFPIELLRPLSVVYTHSLVARYPALSFSPSLAVQYAHTNTHETSSLYRVWYMRIFCLFISSFLSNKHTYSFIQHRVAYKPTKHLAVRVMRLSFSLRFLLDHHRLCRHKHINFVYLCIYLLLLLSARASQRFRLEGGHCTRPRSPTLLLILNVFRSQYIPSAACVCVGHKHTQPVLSLVGTTVAYTCRQVARPISRHCRRSFRINRHTSTCRTHINATKLTIVNEMFGLIEVSISIWIPINGKDEKKIILNSSPMRASMISPLITCVGSSLNWTLISRLLRKSA